jgi:hypothetical protein
VLTKEKLKGKAPEESRGKGRWTGRKRAADAATTASAQPLDATEDRAAHRKTTSTREYNRGLGVLTTCYHFCFPFQGVIIHHNRA